MRPRRVAQRRVAGIFHQQRAVADDVLVHPDAPGKAGLVGLVKGARGAIHEQVELQPRGVVGIERQRQPRSDLVELVGHVDQRVVAQFHKPGDAPRREQRLHIHLQPGRGAQRQLPHRARAVRHRSGGIEFELGWLDVEYAHPALGHQRHRPVGPIAGPHVDLLRDRGNQPVALVHQRQPRLLVLRQVENADVDVGKLVELAIEFGDRIADLQFGFPPHLAHRPVERIELFDELLRRIDHGCAGRHVIGVGDQ